MIDRPNKIADHREQFSSLATAKARWEMYTFP